MGKERKNKLLVSIVEFACFFQSDLKRIVEREWWSHIFECNRELATSEDHRLTSLFFVVA